MTNVLGIRLGLTRATPTALALLDTNAMRLVWSSTLPPIVDDATWHARLAVCAAQLGETLLLLRRGHGVDVVA